MFSSWSIMPCTTVQPTAKDFEILSLLVQCYIYKGVNHSTEGWPTQCMVCGNSHVAILPVSWGFRLRCMLPVGSLHGRWSLPRCNPMRFLEVSNLYICRLSTLRCLSEGVAQLCLTHQWHQSYPYVSHKWVCHVVHLLRCTHLQSPDLNSLGMVGGLANLSNPSAFKRFEVWKGILSIFLGSVMALPIICSTWLPVIC